MVVGAAVNGDEVGREGVEDEVGDIRGGHGWNFGVFPKLELSLSAKGGFSDADAAGLASWNNRGVCLNWTTCAARVSENDLIVACSLDELGATSVSGFTWSDGSSWCSSSLSSSLSSSSASSSSSSDSESPWLSPQETRSSWPLGMTRRSSLPRLPLVPSSWRDMFFQNSRPGSVRMISTRSSQILASGSLWARRRTLMVFSLRIKRSWSPTHLLHAC